MSMPTFRASNPEETQREIKVLDIYKAPAMSRGGFVVAVRNLKNPMMFEPQNGFARLDRDSIGRIVGLEVVDSPLNAHRLDEKRATEIAAWAGPGFEVALFHESCQQRQADLTANN